MTIGKNLALKSGNVVLRLESNLGTLLEDYAVLHARWRGSSSFTPRIRARSRTYETSIYIRKQHDAQRQNYPGGRK